MNLFKIKNSHPNHGFISFQKFKAFITFKKKIICSMTQQHNQLSTCKNLENVNICFFLIVEQEIMPPKKAAAGAKDKGKSGKGSSADDDKSKDKKTSSAGSSIKVLILKFLFTFLLVYICANIL